MYIISPEVVAYSISFFYGTALYAIQLLIPFYLHSQGFSAWEIGIIVAAPNLLRLLVHPFAGAISDRIGERNALMGSFMAITVAALCFSRFSSLESIFAIQLLLMGISRALYYPAIHSYSSRISEAKTPYIFGRLNSLFGAGQMVGLGSSGYLIMLSGFERSFLFSAMVGGLIVFLSLLMPGIPRKKEFIGVVEMAKKLVRVAKIKQIFAGTYCGFAAAIPFVLLSSFYPVYLENEGLTKGLIGVLSAGYTIGFILLGFVIGELLKRFGFRNLATCSLILMGWAMLLIITFPSFNVLLPVLLLLGISTAGPYLSIALSSYGFSVSFLIVPLITGLLVDQLGMGQMLLAVAFFVLILGMLVHCIFNRLGVYNYWAM